ncbi:MAG TPA: ComEC/Rec2 family competence protein [Xanthobacteraceae bacterium]|nr:ComEC/Rec2 family competence protein [Xanthobacteraceae bacterium]
MAKHHKTQGRVGTLPGTAGVAGPWLRPLPAQTGSMVARLREWVAAEVAPGRLMPWLPVAFGLGIVVYFAADREPVWWVATAIGAVVITAAYQLRASPFGFPAAVGCAAIATGFATAALKSRLIDHTILLAPAYSVSVSGFVEAREERERSDRIVVYVVALEAARLPERPERIRLTVRKGAAPAVGAFIALKARLNPPASPFRPGGYDLARDLYFQRIGATGLALGRIEVLPAPAALGWRLGFATAIEAIRDGIDSRIRAAVKGDAGSIASALITGKRDALSGPVFDAMYISGVGHVLSISGYHMALVAGVVFFIVRALLALFPVLALRYAIKKWAALTALAAATLYLVLSGAEVATQRSYIMTAVVLVGVVADRPTLTMRTIAVAALAVMLIVPEAVIHPSFQMSFAATLALIATYERGIPWAASAPDTPLGARIALWGAREIIVLVIASLVAGLATTPYAAYHFHRMAPYGVIANLLAMPVISALSMPAGLLALVAMPFGLDAPLWRLMGVGIDWMVAVAMWVASLPGAVGYVRAFGVGAMLLATVGLIVVCLLRSPLRFVGAGFVLAGCAVAMRAAPPDVMVSASGDVVAVRGADSRLSAVKFGSDTLSLREWLAADGDARLPNDRSVAEGFACDADGCVARLLDGAAVAVSRSAAAFADDCTRAILIVTLRPSPADCVATVLDRATLRSNGAMALTYRNGRFETQSARPGGLDRPWTRRRDAARNTAPPGPAVLSVATVSREATTPQQDVDAEP